MGREERELQVGKRGEGLHEMNLREKLFGLILKGKIEKILREMEGLSRHLPRHHITITQYRMPIFIHATY
jgi:hypothetical protein